MKRFNKFFALLTALTTLFAVMNVAVYAKPIVENDFDMSLVFSPETQLVVYADGEWSDSLSATYGYGDSVTLTAPNIENKKFSHWEADGSVISYANPLKLTVNANTTLYAIYANSAPSAKAAAGFTSVTRSNNGNHIVFQAIADGQATSPGIVYSTSVNDNNLKIDGTDVTNVEAQRLTDSTTVIPQCVIDNNNCYSLEITPDSDDTVYHARAYATVGDDTIYGDIKDVKLSELQNGISMIANLEGFDPESGLEDILAGLTEGIKTVTYYSNGGVGATITQAFKGDSVALRSNTFTRDGYTFSGWSTEEGGSVVYKDGETVTPEGNLVLYAQWTQNRRSGGGGGGGGGSSSSSKVNVYSSGTSANGKLSVSKTNPSKGEIVKITVTPDEGYETDSVTVTDKDGKAIEVTKNEDGTYSYVQPAGNVTITPTFKKTSAEPANSPSPQPTEKPSGDGEKWFKDVPETTWYYAPIKEAFDNSRMSGMSEDYFEPETDITRGMFAYAIYRREGLPTTDAQNKFEDVRADTYYEKAIAWATENGIVAGIDDTHYAPDDQITREQMAAILYRYAQFKGYDVSVGEDTNILDFTDAPDISEYAIPAIQWAVGDSVITGFEDGTMRPKANANRAQMAVILNKIADLF